MKEIVPKVAKRIENFVPVLHVSKKEGGGLPEEAKGRPKLDWLEKLVPKLKLTQRMENSRKKSNQKSEVDTKE